MTHQAKNSPRAAYRIEQGQRVLESASLSATFPKLKSLTVDLALYDPQGLSRSSEVKYTVNLEHAKTVFRFACHNHDCVAGDFDLSRVLAEAVADRKELVVGELHCEGWRNRAAIGTQQCRNLLRYKLTLRF
jgi:hypothetical protein